MESRPWLDLLTEVNLHSFTILTVLTFEETGETWRRIQNAEKSHYLRTTTQVVNMSPSFQQQLRWEEILPYNFPVRGLHKVDVLLPERNYRAGTCVTVCVAVVPLSRGWLRRCVAGSGPSRSSRWFSTRPRWPVWRRLPTVTLCRYTGSTKWLSNAPCRPRMFHLRGGSQEESGTMMWKLIREGRWAREREVEGKGERRQQLGGGHRQREDGRVRCESFNDR